jgi:transcriptional regulator with XRE-family HTH domain
MPAWERARARGRRIGREAIRQIGEELRRRRLEVGASQGVVAGRAGMSRQMEARYESGDYLSARVLEACELLAVVGLGLKVSTYPLGDGPRDTRHATELGGFLAHAAAPLSWRTEVALPNPGDARAWDAVISGAGKRTGVEYERALRDTQAQGRRLALKRRDGGVHYLLLLVAGTRANRAVLAAHPTFMPDLPRRPLRHVIAEVAAGRHPGDGLVFL